MTIALDHTPVSTDLERKLKKISAIIGYVLIIVGLINLIGWACGINWMRPPFVGIVSMKISAAVGFFLGGICLVLRQWDKKQAQLAGSVMAVLILAFAIFIFVSFFIGLDLWPFQKQFFSPATAVFFALAAAGLLAAPNGRQGLPAIMILTTGSLGFFTRVFGIRILHEQYGFGILQGTSIDTYLSFANCSMLAILGLGILISNPRKTLYGLLCSSTRGGYITRRFIPLAVAVPMIWAAAATAGEFAHWYNQPLRWTLFVNGTILSFCLLSCQIAKRLDDIDRSRIVLAEKRADMVYSLAHDLKVPIIGSTQSLDLLLKEVLGQLQPQQRSLLSVLRDSMSDQLWMIENLVYEYQTEQGKEVVSPNTCFVDKLLDDCVEKMMAALQAKNLEVRVSHENAQVAVEADPVALRRVINNLLHNAPKRTAESSIYARSSIQATRRHRPQWLGQITSLGRLHTAQARDYGRIRC
jgi:signal transduction histidine kinase